MAGVTRAELHTTDATRKAMSFHDLRATGLTWLAIRGDDPLKIKQRAGHSSFATTDGYIREALEHAGLGLGEDEELLDVDIRGGVTADVAKDLVKYICKDIGSDGRYVAPEVYAEVYAALDVGEPSRRRADSSRAATGPPRARTAARRTHGTCVWCPSSRTPRSRPTARASTRRPDHPVAGPTRSKRASRRERATARGPRRVTPASARRVPPSAAQSRRADARDPVRAMPVARGAAAHAARAARPRSGRVHARRGAGMTAGIVLASWLHEALHRAAAQRSAWTRRHLRVRAGDVEVLLAAGYVRRVGDRGDAALYEITGDGLAVVARGGRT